MNKEPKANEKHLVECYLRLFYILGSEDWNQLEHLTGKQKDIVYDSLFFESNKVEYLLIYVDYVFF